MYEKQFELNSCSPFELLESIETYESTSDTEIDLIQSFTPVEEIWHICKNSNSQPQIVQAL